MKPTDTLSDAELEQIAASKDSSLAISALVELRKRNERRAFWRGTVTAWIALAVSILSLLVSAGVLKISKEGDGAKAGQKEPSTNAPAKH
jgi:hypothetical protein